MARVVGRIGSARISTNVLHPSGEPPGSTLAAQLADQISDNKKRPNGQGDETFRQLLREVLSGDADQLPHGSAFDTNIDVNYKLIYVIVKAGLDSLNLDNPFREQKELSGQILESLAAIDITIHRNSEVLVAVPSNNDSDSNIGGPLFLWLIPKLLDLLYRVQETEIRMRIYQLLGTALMTERKTHSRGLRTRSILRFLKGCIRDFVNIIESLSSDNAQVQNVSPEVPSESTFLEVYPPYMQLSHRPWLCHIVPENKAEVLGVTVSLLSSFVGLMLEDPGGNGALKPSIFNLDWSLCSLYRLWNALARVDAQRSKPAPSLMVLQDTLRGLHVHLTKRKTEFHLEIRCLILLCQVTAELLAYEPIPLTSAIEKTISLSIIDSFSTAQVSEPLRPVLCEYILPLLKQIREESTRFDGLGSDLQHTISFAIRVFHKNDESLLPLVSDSEIPQFQDLELDKSARNCFCNQNVAGIFDGTARPRKRVRLSSHREETHDLDARSNIVKKIYATLGLEESTVLAGVYQVAVDCYPGLSEGNQCLLYDLLGQLACTSAATISSDLPGFREDCREECPLCDAESSNRSISTIWNDSESEEVFVLFGRLIRLPKSQKLRQPRVAAMIALSRLLSHTENQTHLDLGRSPFGQWCLQALRSSLRELRIAAGRTLSAFLRSSTTDSWALNNRVLAIDFLRNLSDQGDLALQETCILAWGSVARNVSEGDEMNLVLLKLVEYLGHTNSLISGVAYDELQRISNHSPFSALKLFAPYWRTVAVSVVQDLQRRPQIAQQVSDLLAMGVPDFLSLTQVYTVPVLVLRKQQDILQRIADSCGQTIMVLCREHNNLAAILSNMLLQMSNDEESLVMALLKSASPEFDNVDCAELLKSEPQATATELLKFAGEDDEIKTLKAHQALHSIASITHGKHLSSRGSTRRVDVIGPFFESHVLGIMALLADTINDGKGPQPMLEKKRCLAAVREMIKIAKGHVSNGLPQICACLRSAIENKALSNEGFQTWIVMMCTLGEDDIVTLIDPTFAILVQYWDTLQPRIQTQAYDMISYLLKSRVSVIRDVVNTLPSLSPIPLMAKFEEELRKLKAQMDIKHHFLALCQRCENENAVVVNRALVELDTYLVENQAFLHETANSDQPDPVVGQLVRAILDTSMQFGKSDSGIAILCAKCLGSIGCLDPTRIEAVREKREIIILSNFCKDDEIRDFVIFFLREVLVKAFLSATNSRSQGFLAYAMQELLSIGNFEASIRPRSRDAPFDENYRRWVTLPESVRTLLTPFLDSKYFVTAGVPQPPSTYPLYRPDMAHTAWLRTFTFDLLKREAGAGVVQAIFSVLSRIVRLQDISISSFLLPFATLNTVVNGSEGGISDVVGELLAVLKQPLSDHGTLRDNQILCSQTVFQVLDYLSRWMQEKKKEMAHTRSLGTRASRMSSQADFEKDAVQISSVEAILDKIPADTISSRAVECKSYARALFHWEQYVRQQRQMTVMRGQTIDLEPYYERLQDIYTQIDEPDSLEGISAHLQVLNVDQQILEHRKAGRWTAAQSWYELLLTEQPDNLEVQHNLLTSLKESGQFDVLLNQAEAFQHSTPSKALSLPFAAEASWVTGKWDLLRRYLGQSAEPWRGDFNAGIGRALLALSDDQIPKFSGLLDDLRKHTVRGLSETNTTSLQECHDSMLKFHVLTELEAISGVNGSGNIEKAKLLASLDQRLNVLGPFLSDKQYLLGLRRAAMQLSRREFSNIDIASAWLTSAKLARKGNFTHQAFNAVLHASQLRDESATIEHSRLLWREGSHRKAIQSLEGAIAANAFKSHDYTEATVSIMTKGSGKEKNQNMPNAKAHLLLAKWLDRAGQTQSDVIIGQYKKSTQLLNRWERGHYHLGKHYNKLLECEKAKPPGKQAQTFITGETAKLVVENYMRGMGFGVKYIYQTLPRVLTLWLDLGSDTEKSLDRKYGGDEGFRSHIMAQRRKMLANCNSHMKKYIDRLPAFIFYTALSQITARICHPNQSVYVLIVDIVAKVVVSHIPQALWTLLAMVKSSSKDRANRGIACMTKTIENAGIRKDGPTKAEVQAFVTQGQKLSDQLLHVCEGEIQGKASSVSLTRDLGFNHKLATCKLAIPLESSLTASLPTVTDNVNLSKHKAFSKSDYIHISSFLDDVLVLNSLQRPRKISIRGSDGHIYALLCKPKDDLRKDQRLMEFNAMINRTLKRDAESSKRRLYIKTYAVTPLNEECGLIEWIDNLKTLREILLNSYKQNGVTINYSELRVHLNESISEPNKLPIFTKRIISHFPPIFHEWFVEMFPEPGAWFTARLRYTRSCAVMSVVGHVLGLGDRHGENILFEEGNGGTLHVDFNCLFDKGLTFEKPELVPFRLTHNMVDAFGAYGVEGPFRKSCELTLAILRQNEDTLMTILETFLYDPTTDFIGKKKKSNPTVPDTPEGVLESVRNKVRGLLPSESVPLSVEGYVDELVRQATDPFKLASMYIGWCAFF